MLTFDEAGEMLDEIALSLPEEFYMHLNGGVNLLPGVKHHRESGADGSLYIMGEYHHDPRGLGRYINIYYGSVMRVYGHYEPKCIKEELRRVLVHEFTHHLESLGGERGLEHKDEAELEMWRARKRRR